MKSFVAKLEKNNEEEEKNNYLAKNNKQTPNGIYVGRKSLNSAKTAELFRTDLISAMKLADMEPLQPHEYFLISDPWKPDWEKGVQVPVNEDYIDVSSVRIVEGYEKLQGLYGFKLPAGKLLHAVCDENYKRGIHELHEGYALEEQVCRYDLDDLDQVWLKKYNEERSLQGKEWLMEYQLELAIAEFEAQCFRGLEEKMATIKGIEFDETVVCDVCRSPESEDTNEMVFCDGCNICVHQACYGIMKVPQGSWLCNVCSLGIKPPCALCPRTGGAMKCTKNGANWTHVSCALWIPEVGIGDPDKMEPIIRLSEVPAARFELTCYLCGEKKGACIQCCCKSCRDAFHVTCAFDNRLDMIITLADVQEGGVRFKSYCKRHSRKKEDRKSAIKQLAAAAQMEDDKAKIKAQKLQEWNDEFYSCVSLPIAIEQLQMPASTVQDLYSYWLLKRKVNFNRSLFGGRKDFETCADRQKELLAARLNMFMQLRQNMERLRNLCYLLGRREKERHQLYSMKETIFEKQVELASLCPNWPAPDLPCGSVTEAHRTGADIYDNYDLIMETAKRLDDTSTELNMSVEDQNERNQANNAALVALRKKRILAQSDYVRKTLHSIVATHRSRNNDDEEWKPPGEEARAGSIGSDMKKKRTINIPKRLIDDLGISLEEEFQMRSSRSPSVARADVATTLSREKKKPALTEVQKPLQRMVSLGTALNKMKKDKIERQLKRSAEKGQVIDTDMADFETPKRLKEFVQTVPHKGAINTKTNLTGNIKNISLVNTKSSSIVNAKPNALVNTKVKALGSIKTNSQSNLEVKDRHQRNSDSIVLSKKRRLSSIDSEMVMKKKKLLSMNTFKRRASFDDVNGTAISSAHAKPTNIKSLKPALNMSQASLHAELKAKAKLTGSNGTIQRVRNSENLAEFPFHDSQRKSLNVSLESMFSANQLVVDGRIKQKVMEQLGATESKFSGSELNTLTKPQYRIDKCLSNGCKTIEEFIALKVPHFAKSLLSFKTNMCWQGSKRAPLRPNWSVGKNIKKFKKAAVFPPNNRNAEAKNLPIKYSQLTQSNLNSEQKKVRFLAELNRMSKEVMLKEHGNLKELNLENLSSVKKISKPINSSTPLHEVSFKVKSSKEHPGKINNINHGDSKAFSTKYSAVQTHKYKADVKADSPHKNMAIEISSEELDKKLDLLRSGLTTSTLSTINQGKYKEGLNANSHGKSNTSLAAASGEKIVSNSDHHFVKYEAKTYSKLSAKNKLSSEKGVPDVSRSRAADCSSNTKFQISVSKAAGVQPPVICITSSHSLLLPSKSQSSGEKHSNLLQKSKSCSNTSKSLISKDNKKLPSNSINSSINSSSALHSGINNVFRNVSQTPTTPPDFRQQNCDKLSNQSPVVRSDSKTGGKTVSPDHQQVKPVKQKLSFEEALASATPADVSKKKDRLSLNKGCSADKVFSNNSNNACVENDVKDKLLLSESLSHRTNSGEA